MPTTNKTNSSGVFNQQSMGQYNQLQSGIGSNLQDFMNNPLQSSFFNTQVQMAQKANGNRMQSQNQALMQNAQTGGYVGNLPAFMQGQLNQNSRQLSANNSNSFNSLLLGANQLRFGATQQAMGYKPLQTGTDTTQSQGGIGSWLTPIASAAIGGLTGGLGKSLLGGGGNTGDSGAFQTNTGGLQSLAGSNASNGSFIGGMNTYQGGGNTLIG